MSRYPLSSRVLRLLDFDHRQRIQFFRAREYAEGVGNILTALLGKAQFSRPLIIADGLKNTNEV